MSSLYTGAYACDGHYCTLLWRDMASRQTKFVTTHGAEATEVLGAAFGARLRGGEVIELTSDLGGGKTTFVRGLARGLGSRDHVASPTFTISRQYRVGDKLLLHFDFYRLSEPGIMADELAEAIGDPKAVVIVEWGDVVQSVLPHKRITIEITVQGEQERLLAVHYPQSLSYAIPKGV